MLGTVIGQYRIVEQVGRGTAGTVYKAIDESLNREVAIKVLNPDLAATEVIKRFRTEATALARLNHPAIATIYELFRSQTDLLMVMEFVHGETLEHLSRRLGALEPERAAYLIDQLLWGLGHAHAAGIVHRDIKPSNVMLTTGGAVKIMDFGIARVRGAEHATADGCMLGTPAYIAPEQITGAAVDGRADLYSVGVIFYRLLTGALPFKAETPVEMLRSRIADAPDPLDVHRQDLPDWCEAIVQRALAKSPADRFQTADDFRDVLSQGARILTRTDLVSDLALVGTETIWSSPAHAPAPAAPRVADGGTLVLKKPQYVSRPLALASAAAIVALVGYLGLSRPAAVPQPVAPSPMASAAAPAVPPVSAPAAAPVSAPTGAPVKAANKPALGAPAAPINVVTAAAGSSPKPEAPPVKRTYARVVFEAKALVSSGKNHREHDAELALADGKIRVAMGNDGRQRVLHSVPYENVTSISYSRGRDPVWMSPEGPATVVRVGGGAFGMFRRDRHWITLHTNTTQEFVILRTGESNAGKVVAALEARTGRRAQLVTARSGG